MVNARNPVMIIARNITATVAESERTNPDNMSHRREPIPNVILLRARIVPYSLGSA
jgi:hypothetical protein